MKSSKIVFLIVFVLIIVLVGAYFALRPKTDTVLPNCEYGPTDAVLNEPCDNGGFNP